MSSPRRFVWRSAIGAIGASALCLGPAATTASAHVEAGSSDAVRGGVAVVSFQVPNESTTGAATTSLTVDLTNVSAVRTEAKPGWTAKLDREGGSGAVRSVTWTAAPDGGIAVDEFGVFRISVKLPDADTVSFPATQTYADGAVVKWDQPSIAGQAEPERPAPKLVVAGGAPSNTQHTAQPTATAAPPAPVPPAADNTARVLAGAALLLAAVGVGAA
ncbi:MAG: YcnI family protein, partial [Mycobacterium sp.]